MYYVLLFFIILSLLFLFLVITKCDFFQPYVIVSSAYLLSLMFSFIGKNNWNNYELSFKSVLVVSIIFVLVFIFSLLSYLISNKHMFSFILNKKYNFNDSIHFNNKYYIIILIIIMTMAISIFIDRYIGAIKNNYNDEIYNIGKLSRFVYQISLFSNYKMLHINTYFNYLLTGVLSMSIYSIINNTYIYKENAIQNIDHIVLLCIAIFNTFMSGQRGNMFFCVSVSIGVFGFMFNNKKHLIKDYVLLLKNLILVFLVFFVFWIITLFLINNNINILTYINDFITYISGGIITFDEYINGLVIINKPVLFGDRVFANIYGYLNRLHLGHFDIVGSWIPTVDTVIGINIYSGFFFSYESFGLFGCALYWSIILFLFTYVYNSLLKDGSLILIQILYSYFCMPLYLISFSDNFATRFISTTPIYIICFFSIVYVVYYKFSKKKDGITL